MKKLTLPLFLFVSILYLGQAFAEVPEWKIVPEGSTIKFTGTQNNAPITGEFKKFDAKIKFDPKNLKESKISFTVDMNSVSAGFAELATMLKTLDWFNVASFPQATFESTEITPNDKGGFQVKGDLMVRDKKAPVTADVVIDENTSDKLKLHGTAKLLRTTFGVGQGEWADTAEVRDPVDVNFNLNLKRD